MELDDSHRTLKVTNLSRDAEREDLYDLFGRFGSIERITLVRDHVTRESRGTAFVCFRSRRDAEEAMETLHGHAYDYQILSIEWAKPRAEQYNRSLGDMKVSGYGKALPQGLK
jgi:translation initiation factor 3 subunit G